MARRNYGTGNLKALRQDGGGVLWQARWRDAAGRRCQRVVASDRRVAERALAEIIRERDLAVAGVKPEDGLDLTFDDLRDRYLADLKTTVKPLTHAAAKSHLKRIRAFLGPIRLRDLRRDRVLQYRQRRLADGVCHRTVNHETGALHAMCAWALAAELIGRNPVAGLKRLPVGRAFETRPRRALNADELDATLAAAEAIDDERRVRHAAELTITNATKGVNYNERDRALFLPQAPFLRALALTGSRFGELAQTTWGDFDPKARTLTLRASTTKSKRERRVPLVETVECDLARLVEIHAEGYGRPPKPTEFIFLSPAGYPLLDQRDNARRFLRDALKRAKIDHKDGGQGAICLHSLRHTFASLLARANAGLTQVQQLLGHSTPELTARVYTHHEHADLRAAVDKLRRA